MKEFDYQILLEFFPKWRDSKKKERGQIRKQLESLTGLSKATLHRMFNNWLEGKNIFNLIEKKTKRKVSAIELEKQKEVATIVSAIQRASQKGSKNRAISRSEAIRIGISAGVLNKEDVKHHSTVGRWQQKFGLTMRQFEQNKKQNRQAIHIDYKYANNVFSIDATVLDKYFLDIARGKLHERPAYLPKGDNHEIDYMSKNSLVKVWVYYLVDCYSGAFWLKAYIPTKSNETSKYGGENSIDMLDFLRECFLSKTHLEFSADVVNIFGNEVEHLKNCPLEGVPNSILVDNGSPCNTKLRPFLTRLGINVDTHEPGNPRVKKAESIISVSKKVVESILNLLSNKQIASIEILNYILQSNANHYCLRERKYHKYIESAINHPIKKVNLLNLRDALVERRSRTIDRYGEIKVAWDKTGSKKYFVGKHGDNIPVGTKVHVYKDIEGNVCAQVLDTLKIYKCTLSEEINQVEYGQFKGIPDSQADKLRKVVDIEAVRVKRSIDVSHVVQPISSVVIFPPKTENIQTSSIVAPNVFNSVEEAKTYIVMATGVGFDSISQKLTNAIENSLESILIATGKIDSEFVLLCVNKIREEINYSMKIGG